MTMINPDVDAALAMLQEALNKSGIPATVNITSQAGTASVEVNRVDKIKLGAFRAERTEMCTKVMEYLIKNTGVNKQVSVTQICKATGYHHGFVSQFVKKATLSMQCGLMKVGDRVWYIGCGKIVDNHTSYIKGLVKNMHMEQRNPNTIKNGTFGKLDKKDQNWNTKIVIPGTTYPIAQLYQCIKNVIGDDMCKLSSFMFFMCQIPEYFKVSDDRTKVTILKDCKPLATMSISEVKR